VKIIERGSGTPLVFIPPLQGRWEYMSETVGALAQHVRVVTFSLCGERGSGLRFDRARGLANYVDQVVRALDERRIDRAVVCGVSFGGVVALHVAAAHPDRVSALVLASTPGPSFRLRPRHLMYARVPWLFGPVFLAEIPRRFRPEFAAALPDARMRRRFALRQLGTFVRAPLSLRRMAQRAKLISTLDLGALCRRVSAPTLVITGEAALDFVVPVEGSSDYTRLIAGARGVVLERTGHHGTITRPEAFAALVGDFASRLAERGQKGRAAS
jgi:pimeloyl-ACP methyl ester carboxylesterase